MLPSPTTTARTGRSGTRVILAAASALLVLLPGLPGPEAGIGTETWADPSRGPFRENFTNTWVLFVLNLNDVACSNVGPPLGTGDLANAVAMRNHFIAQGVPANQITILLDKGNATYPVASELMVRFWIQNTLPLANAASDSRVLFFFAGHGNFYGPGSFPVPGWRLSRPFGSYICLNGGQEMLDQEFQSYVLPFQPHVQLGLLASCSLCGGFADRFVGPVDNVGTTGFSTPNRIVAVGCGILTECTGHPTAGSRFFTLWLDGATTGAADGWTYLVRNDATLAYDSRIRDGRVTFEEAYYYALSRSTTYADPLPGPALAQRFVIRDTLDGGFVVRKGGTASVANEGTGGCSWDGSDYDGDGLVNPVDVVNEPTESRAAVAMGGYVRSETPTSTTFELVVTSPSGHVVTFVGGRSNNSLDSFQGEPVDGTWAFEQRSGGPISRILEVRLNDKVIRDPQAKSTQDLGTLVWNWHAGSRLDDTILLDVDPCPASALRVYKPATGLTVP